VALFEIGSRFTTTEGETRGVGAAFTGSLASEHWSGSAREVDFADAKGLVEQICDVLGVDAQLQPASYPFLVAGQSAAVVAGNRPIGLLGLVVPAVAEGRGAPRQDRIFVAELNLELAAAAAHPRDELIRALPRHPTVVRDLSIVVVNTLPAEIIRDTIHAAAAAGPAPLASSTFFDRYTGKGVDEGSVSLSVRLTFQALDRTLTDAEVQQSFDGILAALVREHHAVQR
jgi:phenylalanyl-tRNA synthetase beta chain